MAGNFGKDTTTIAISITFHKLSKYDLSPVFTPRIKNPLIYMNKLENLTENSITFCTSSKMK